MKVKILFCLTVLAVFSTVPRLFSGPECGIDINVSETIREQYSSVDFLGYSPRMDIFFRESVKPGQMVSASAPCGESVLIQAVPFFAKQPGVPSTENRLCKQSPLHLTEEKNRAAVEFPEDF